VLRRHAAEGMYACQAQRGRGTQAGLGTPAAVPPGGKWLGRREPPHLSPSSSMTIIRTRAALAASRPCSSGETKGGLAR
jgi:hypothetical protein